MSSGKDYETILPLGIGNYVKWAKKDDLPNKEFAKVLTRGK
jgi:hypothetical protein